ncbi:MAG: HAD family hydrolase [Chitinophagales bacterium]|nr:HAD family hydrolase [Chitinophagales bacterium]
MPFLFLDRDGVLNVRPPGDYVKTPEAFIPVPGLAEALAQLHLVFARIFVVTNQAGIGKGLMTEADLARVHDKLQQLAAEAGVALDAIYYCPHRREEKCACRKPATGMGLQAKAAFPEINFSESWMVGDSLSDIAFGQALGMRTALIEGKAEEAEAAAAIQTEGRFPDLPAFARFISSYYS